MADKSEASVRELHRIWLKLEQLDLLAADIVMPDPKVPDIDKRRLVAERPALCALASDLGEMCATENVARIMRGIETGTEKIPQLWESLLTVQATKTLPLELSSKPLRRHEVAGLLLSLQKAFEVIEGWYDILKSRLSPDERERIESESAPAAGGVTLADGKPLEKAHDDENAKYLFRDEIGVFRVRFEDEDAIVPRQGNDGAAYVHAILQNKVGVPFDAAELYHFIHGGAAGAKENSEENEAGATNTGWSRDFETREAREDRKRLEGVIEDLHEGVAKARASGDEAQIEKFMTEISACYKEVKQRGGKVERDEKDGTVCIKGKFRSANEIGIKTPDKAIAMAIQAFREKLKKGRSADGFEMPKFAAHLEKHVRARRYHPRAPVPDWKF